MSSQKLHIETDFDSGTTATTSSQQPKVALSTSTSSLSLSQEPWNKVQSSYAAKRKQMQAERMRQLQELEEQVTETANWNQRRKDLVTTSSRRLTLNEDNHVYPASNSSSPSSSSSTPPRSRQASNGSSGAASHRVDLGDATLEDLEGLIAASAKRLASYRLRNQKLDATSQDASSPSPPRKKNDDMDKWKQLLDSNSSSGSGNQRISTTTYYSPDAAVDPNYAMVASSISPVVTPTKSTSQIESGEKSPSASYLRLRNMFEKDTHYKKLDTNTLLSSKAPQPSEPSFSKKSTSSFSLADLAHPPSSPSLSCSSSSALLNSHRKTIPSSNDWKTKRDELSGITGTRSSISSATTPKIESPRISASTTPRVSTSSIHLRKAPRSHLSQSQAAAAAAEAASISPSLSSSSSSSLIDQQKKNGEATGTTARSRKLSTLASLQQRQRQNHVAMKQQDVADRKDDNDIKSVDDYMNSIKKTSSTLNARSHRAESSNSSEEVSHRRKVKLSITTSSNANSASSSSSISNIRKPKETSTVSKSHATAATTVVRRKRGKVKKVHSCN